VHNYNLGTVIEVKTIWLCLLYLQGHAQSNRYWASFMQ